MNRAVNKAATMVAGLVIAASGLAGCAGVNANAFSRGVDALSGSTPTPNPFDLSTRQWDATGSYLCGAGAVPAAPDEPSRYLGYAVPATLVDGGPQTGAMGTATYDHDGQPVAYTVVEGDTFIGVEMRFCTPGFYLEFVNSIRRGTTNLYVGDTVNLSADTMTTVGDVNGEVHNHKPAFGADYIPPQR